MNSNLYFCISETENIEASAINFLISVFEPSDAESLKNELQNYISNGQYFEFVSTCSKYISNIVSVKKPEEIASFITIISDAIGNIENDNDVFSATEELSKSICSIESFSSAIKMKLLNVLYNSSSNFSNEKVVILDYMVNYCEGYEETLFNFILSINQADWDIDNNVYRSLLISLYNKLNSIQKPLRCREVLLKYLLSFENNHDDPIEAIPYAVQSLIYYLMYITPVNEYNELDFKAITLLKSTEEYHNLYDLVVCIKSGNISSLDELYALNETIMKENNITKESLLTSTRLSLLLSLVNSKPVNTFEEIAQSLRISEDEVEKWIIEGYKNKLIEGKVNQINNTFTITRCNCLDVNEESWQYLHEKLTAWKESIDKAIDSIHTFQH